MEINLEKKKRIAILKKAIDIISKEKISYICVAVEKATCRLVHGYNYDSCDHTIERFPELLKYKPRKSSEKGPWFPMGERKIRIIILKQVIEDIENEK